MPGLLIWMMILPLIGSVIVAFGAKTALLAKQIALLFSVATLAVTIIAITRFDPSSPDAFQLVERREWISSLGVTFSVGVDGIALVLVFLATLLVPLVIWAGWNDVEDTADLPSTDQQPSGSVQGYFALMLVLEAFMVGVFVALDVFLFYFIFEAMLIPVYFMIGRFGTGRRTYAAVKFLIYSLAGGLVMLAGLALLWYVSTQAFGSPDLYMPNLLTIHIDPTLQTWLFWAFFIAFAIKAPLWPVHTWLPDASGAATPGTAILLIGVLDKIGTFGMMRFCLPLFPDASKEFAPVVIVLAVIGIFYGALVAIGQTDMKRLFGYVSISHFGFITLGIFVFTNQAQVGASFYMLGHGISTALLFIMAGYMISRRKSANVDDYGGMSKPAPVLAGLMLVAGLTSLALPGMSTFLSEFMVLLGSFTRYPWVAAFATLGIILAALYILLLYQRTMTGPETENVRGLPDLSTRERWAVAPLIALVIFLGFYPAPVLNVLNPAVERTMSYTGSTDPAPIVVPPQASGQQNTPAGQGATP